MKTLTKTVVSLVLTLASLGLLPRAVVAVRQAQAQLIQESKASKWGQLPLLPESGAVKGQFRR